MKPLIGLTMGDPAGVGPEIVLKAISRLQSSGSCRLVVFGDASYLKLTQKRSLKNHPARKLGIVPVGDFPQAGMGEKSKRSSVCVVQEGRLPHAGRLFRGASRAGGRVSGCFIRNAVEAATKGIIDAVVTAPINKQSFYMGGWGKKFIGHTEMLAALTRTKKFALMLVAGKLRAVHVTSHMPLRKVSSSLSIKKIFETIELAGGGLSDLGIISPKIAVSGLNPHAGDGGLLGREEIQIISPAIRKARDKGLKVSGPFSPDVLWPLVMDGTYDVGVAMFHDQGQIPVKMISHLSEPRWLSTEAGVNVTLGLPIIRTSVAHGTAYDIAHKGLAAEGSLVEAVQLAVRMAGNRKTHGFQI